MEKTYDIMSLFESSEESRTIKKDSCIVTLIDCKPRICPVGRTVEFSAVNSARVSFGKGLKTVKQDNRLLNYLIKNEHTSPLESIVFTFRIECPLYISKQIMRHRTFSFNEFSQRYATLDENKNVENKVYIPTLFRKQDEINKQSSEGEIDNNELAMKIYTNAVTTGFKTYNNLIKMGVCRELARGVLPTCTMTSFYATVNLNNLFKFLKLRLAKDAQFEIQEVARSMRDLTSKIAPIAFKYWNSK